MASQKVLFRFGMGRVRILEPVFFEPLRRGFFNSKKMGFHFFAVHRSCIKIFEGIMSFCHMKIKKP